MPPSSPRQGINVRGINDLRLIGAFCAVYEEGSISKAAARLNIAQPSISIAIRNLELDLDTILFERSANGTVPTTKAHALYVRMQKVLADLEDARAMLVGDPRQARERLRIGIPPGLAKGILPGFLPRFLDEHPRLDLKIAEDLPRSLIDLVVSGELDFAILAASPIDSRLTSRRLASEPLALIAAATNTRIADPTADLRTMQPLKLVLPWTHHTLRAIVEQSIGAAEFRVSKIIDVGSITTTLELVKTSDWVTVLPLSSVSECYGDYSIRQLESPRMPSEYCLISTRRGALPPLAQLFVDEIQGGLARSASTWRAHIEGKSARV